MSIKRSYSRRPAQIRVIMIVAAILFFVFTMSFGREYVNNLQTHREIAQLKADEQRLTSQTAEQLQQLQRLSSEYYLEQQAREKHNLAAPGEQVFVVKDAAGEIRNTVTVPPAPPAPLPNWRQWLNYFFVHNYAPPAK